MDQRGADILLVRVVHTVGPGLTGGYAESNASGPSTCGLYQTVTLPAEPAALSLQLGTFSSGLSANDRASLQIRTNANVILTTLYTRTGDQPLDSVQARGPYDLSAYAGQTARIYFETTHITAPYNQRIDSVVPGQAPVAVPTLSEWAMILFGSMLAGSAALYLHRRRLAS